MFQHLRLLVLLFSLFLVSSCGPGMSAGIPLATNTPELAGTVVRASPPSASSVHVFVLPDDGVLPVLQGIRKAQRSIWLEIYLLTDRQIIRALEEAANRGVDVRILIESHPYGGIPVTATINALEATGVKVKPANPAFSLTHEKSMVIDGETAYILTANLTVAAFKYNREYGVIDEDAQDVQEIAAIFIADWERHTVVLTDPRLVVSPVSSRGKLLGLINGARHTLFMEAEEIQERSIEDALIAASKRGVLLRVITSSPKTSEGEQVQDYNAEGIRRLRSGGGEVKLLDHLYMHAKLIIADNRLAYAGSINISTPSLDTNRELGIIISDPTALSKMASTFETDWAASR